jgi:hypothetical protein
MYTVRNAKTIVGITQPMTGTKMEDKYEAGYVRMRGKNEAVYIKYSYQIKRQFKMSLLQILHDFSNSKDF